RRADDPVAALRRFVATTPNRVLIAAESLGRRETMQQYFAECDFKPDIVADWAAFAAGAAHCALVVSPLHTGFVWPAAKLVCNGLTTSAQCAAPAANAAQSAT